MADLFDSPDLIARVDELLETVKAAAAAAATSSPAFKAARAEALSALNAVPGIKDAYSAALAVLNESAGVKDAHNAAFAVLNASPGLKSVRDNALSSVTSSPAFKAASDKASVAVTLAVQSQAAEAYRLIEEMRRAADKRERDLIRNLRWDAAGNVIRTWAQVAEVVDAQLGSRQAAHARWGRLKSPARRTTTGDARRGAAKPQEDK